MPHHNSKESHLFLKIQNKDALKYGSAGSLTPKFGSIQHDYQQKISSN